jgi:hypothetical protein
VFKAFHFFAIVLLIAVGRGVAMAADADVVVHSGDSVIDVRIADDQFAVSQAEMLDWVKRGAKAVSNYLGKFPVAQVTIDIAAEDVGGQIHGTTYGGQLIRMRIGHTVSARDLADDWVMTHEMFHLAFPTMGQQHLWMNEGLSVYLEPIARSRIGILTTKEYWKELVEGLQNGQPEAGDKGLDQTHTWGRTYWGGTIFWFLVDLKIREQTHGKKSVDDVIKTILAAGGDGSVTWPMEKVLDMGDQATGTHVMHDVYDQLVPQAHTVDFGPIWKQLGVNYNDGDVTFDDTARLAWLRKAITSPGGHGEERH